MNYEKQERELHLKDLVFCVLRRWRSILVLALVCALALGGLKFCMMKSADGQSTNRTAYLEALAAYEQKYAAKQHEVQWLTNRVEQHRTYMQESIMMGIDPTNVCRAGLDAYIVGVDEETSRRMLDDYRAALNSNAFILDAAEELQIESKYLWELVTVSVKEATVGESTQRYINVVIDYDDLDGAARLLDLVQEQMRSAGPAIQSELGAHTLEMVRLEAAVRVDTSGLAAKQWLEKERFTHYESALATSKKALSAMSAPADPAGPDADVVRGTLKFAIIGILLGGVLGCGWGVLAFLFGDKLYAASDLRGRYDVKILGVVAGKGKRCIIDKLLDRLEGRVTEENAPLLAAVVTSQLSGGSGILIGPRGLTDELADRLGVSLTAQRLTDAQTLKQLEGCDGVILVCVCGKDRYSQIGKSMELAADLGKRITGCIVAEY